MFLRKDLEMIADLLKEAAAAEIMPRFRNLSEGSVREKSSEIDLVTIADEAAERYIFDKLPSAFPSALLVGEETCAKDPSLLDQIGDADLAIIIDPIDGTANFASGVTMFGVMAGISQRGEIIGGIIYDPVIGDWVMALRGEGAWFRTPDERTHDLKVQAARPVDEMLGVVSWNMLPLPSRHIVAANCSQFRAAYSFRNAAHEYRLMATGHIHFCMYNKLMPWDHVPGALIIQEAGGYVARFNGSPFDATTHEGGLIAAPDQASWAAIRETLFAVPDPARFATA